MKILSNKEYLKLINEIEATKNENNETINNLMLSNKDYELQVEEILNRLKEMVSPTNVKMGRDKYKDRIKDLIIFIQGKQKQEK